MDVISATVMTTTGATGAKAVEPNVLAVVMLVVGVLVLGLILIWSIRGKIARRQAATPTPHERIERIKASAGARDSVEGARAELVDTARRLAAQLDVKAARLEQLIVQADERIATLRRSGGGAIPLATAFATDDTTPDGVSDDAAPDDAAPDAAAPDDETPARATPVPAGIPLDPLTTQVYELADGGHDPVAIAQTLDEQIGKVELILALRESA